MLYKSLTDYLSTVLIVRYIIIGISVALLTILVLMFKNLGGYPILLGFLCLAIPVSLYACIYSVSRRNREINALKKLFDLAKIPTLTDLVNSDIGLKQKIKGYRYTKQFGMYAFLSGFIGIMMSLGFPFSFMLIGILIALLTSGAATLTIATVSEFQALELKYRLDQTRESM